MPGGSAPVCTHISFRLPESLVLQAECTQSVPALSARSIGRRPLKSPTEAMFRRHRDHGLRAARQSGPDR